MSSAIRELKELHADPSAEAVQSPEMDAYVQAIEKYKEINQNIKDNAKELRQVFDVLPLIPSEEEQKSLQQVVAALKAKEEQLKKDLLTAQNNLIEQLKVKCAAYPAPESTDTTDIPRALYDATHAVFLINGLFLAAVFRIDLNLALSIATAAMGCKWNGWDGGAGLASIYHSGEKTSEHDKFWDKVQTFSNVQLLLATTVNTAYFVFELAAKMGSPLASTVIANAPAALGVLNAPSFAFCMGLATANAFADMREAGKKSTDARYFEEKCLEEVAAEVDLLANPRQTIWERLTNKDAQEQLVLANERIQRKKADAKALGYYAEYQGMGSQDQQAALKSDENRHNVIHAKLLMEQQAQKEKEHAIKAGVWTAATVVMTAACFAMPASVIVGILAVGAIKMAQTAASRIMDDYNAEAVAYANDAQQEVRRDGSTVPKTEEELYTDALKGKVKRILGEGNPTLDSDVAAMKTRLSAEHRQNLIHTEAKRDYTVKLYLNRKAEQISNKASELSNKVCSFFSIASPSTDTNETRKKAQLTLGRQIL